MALVKIGTKIRVANKSDWIYNIYQDTEINYGVIRGFLDNPNMLQLSFKKVPAKEVDLFGIDQTGGDNA